MQRITEPELMLDPEQVDAYAKADFEEPHSGFIELFKSCFPDDIPSGYILELGCGPGDITFRLAREFGDVAIDAVDGSGIMIRYADSILEQKTGLRRRISFYHSLIENFRSGKKYNYIISNSLLHHIHIPDKFWKAIIENSAEGTRVFVMDLSRPADITDAKELVEIYASKEPEILKRDFYNSLLASFTPEEVGEQIRNSGLHGFKVVPSGDRHLYAFGGF